MKTLTMKQPWAQLLVEGHKKIETRSWSTSFRGELLIHSSKKFYFSDVQLCEVDEHYKRAIPDYTKLPTGAIIGSVLITDCVRTEDIRETLSAQELAFGDYRDGRLAWITARPRLFKNPIMNVSGALSLWEYKPVVAIGNDNEPQQEEPGEPDYNAPNEHERAEMMARYQRLK